MTTPQNRRRCQVQGCTVIVFDLVFRFSGIGDDEQQQQRETSSDNAYACAGPDRQGCLCQRHGLDSE